MEALDLSSTHKCSHTYESGIVTRSMFRNMIAFTTYISMIEPKNIKEVLEDADWIVAIQEKLNQFERNKI